MNKHTEEQLKEFRRKFVYQPDESMMWVDYVDTGKPNPDEIEAFIEKTLETSYAQGVEDGVKGLAKHLKKEWWYCEDFHEMDTLVERYQSKQKETKEPLRGWQGDSGIEDWGLEYKPKHNDNYYYIEKRYGKYSICMTIWENSWRDKKRIRLFPLYRTLEEAEQQLSKINRIEDWESNSLKE